MYERTNGLMTDETQTFNKKLRREGLDLHRLLARKTTLLKDVAM